MEIARHPVNLAYAASSRLRMCPLDSFADARDSLYVSGSFPACMHASSRSLSRSLKASLPETKYQTLAKITTPTKIAQE